MTKKRSKRRHFTAEQKVSFLRRHFVDKVAISEICQEESIQPSQFLGWQKTFFENGSKAFDKSREPLERSKDKRIETLEEIVRRKEHVISELMDEHVALKKKNSAPW